MGYRDDSEALKLAFVPSLEQEYRNYYYERLRRRQPAIGWSGLLLFFGYSLFDLWAMQGNLSALSVFLRLGIVCPLIALVIYAARRQWPYARFMRLYGLTFATACLCVGLIVFLGHFTNTYLPYQGLLLLIIFGYYLMMMPTWLVTVIATSLSALYLGVEYLVSRNPLDLGYQMIFFVTANMMGFVGSLLQERSLRLTFLQERQLEHSRQSLLEENARKTQWFASATHDLKQPLLAASLLVDELEAHADAPPSPKILSRLRYNLNELGTLNDSVMGAMQLERGVIQPRLQDLALLPVLRSLVDELMAAAQDKGIRLKVDADPAIRVHTDATLLGRILRNLVENAIKHSSATRITLIAETRGRQLHLMVRDNGKGIPETSRSQVFEPFYRQSPGTPGLGLGLSIVRQLAELMGIPLHLENSPMGGCQFRLILPGVPSAGKSPELLSVHLSINDDPDTRDMLGHLLGRWGVSWKDLDAPPSSLGRSALVISRGESGLSTIAEQAGAEDQPGFLVLDGMPGYRAPCEGTLILKMPLKPARLRLALEHFCDERNLTMAREATG